MVTTEVSYICDCCGRKVSVPQTLYEDGHVRDLYLDHYPDGWQKMIEPFGLCCDHCMNAFMNVYDSLRR